MRGGVDSERESSVGETSQHLVQHRLALRETDTFCSEEFLFPEHFQRSSPAWTAPMVASRFANSGSAEGTSAAPRLMQL